MENIELETNALEYSFGQKQAVDKVSFHVKKAGIYVLAGKSGSGKTTFLELLANQRTPSSGEITLAGKKQKAGSHKPIGYLSEDPSFEVDRTLKQNLKLKESLTPGAKGTSEEVMALLKLESYADRKVKTLSTGVRKMAALAMALIGWPELVLLDDPCSFLGFDEKRELTDILRKLAEDRGMTFIAACRRVDTVVEAADQLGFLVNGRLVREMTREEFNKESVTDARFRVNSADAAKKVLQRFSVTEGDGGWLTVASGSLDVSALNEALMGSGVEVLEIRRGRMSRDELFEALMEGGRYA